MLSRRRCSPPQDPRQAARKINKPTTKAAHKDLCRWEVEDQKTQATSQEQYGYKCIRIVPGDQNETQRYDWDHTRNNSISSVQEIECIYQNHNEQAFGYKAQYRHTQTCEGS